MGLESDHLKWAKLFDHNSFDWSGIFFLQTINFVSLLCYLIKWLQCVNALGNRLFSLKLDWLNLNDLYPFTVHTDHVQLTEFTHYDVKPIYSRLQVAGPDMKYQRWHSTGYCIDSMPLFLTAYVYWYLTMITI